MRILHISTRLIVGGSQENTVLSCEGQAALGHDVHLAYGPIFGPEGSMLPRVRGFRAAGGATITTHEVPHLVREINPADDARCYRELRRLIREVRPDVVHTHSSKAGIVGRVAAWHEGGARGRLAVVHTIHGPPFHAYQSARKNALYVALEKAAARRCHLIISVADAMTAQFRQRGIGRPEQYLTVRSGMDVEPFVRPLSEDSRERLRAGVGLEPQHLVIGTVARLAELKGHDDLIDALADDLLARDDLRLLWVGDGWWTPRLTARLLRHDIRHKVVLTGLVPPERVPELVRAMDVVVHPSYREGLPRVVPQALLAARPVVAYDADGTSEACIDGVTGKLVPTGDVPGLREAVRWTLAHLPEARTMALEGQRRCLEQFSAAAMVQGLEAAYARAMELAGKGKKAT